MQPVPAEGAGPRESQAHRLAAGCPPSSLRVLVILTEGDSDLNPALGTLAFSPLSHPNVHIFVELEKKNI